MLLTRLQRFPQGADNYRVASFPGDRPLLSEILGGNPFFPFPGRAVTSCCCCGCQASSHHFPPPPSPQPRGGCQEVGHTALHVSGALRRRCWVWNSSSGHMRSSQPRISASGGEGARPRNELTQPAGLRKLLLGQQEPRESDSNPC